MHHLRIQRNALQHRQARPLDDPGRWRSECRHAISSLQGDTGGEASMPLPLKLLLWGMAAYAVLNNERLMELMVLGTICYLVFKAISSK